MIGMDPTGDVLAKLCHQLQQEDCQRVKDVLRKADSVIGDEFDELHTTLNVKNRHLTFAALFAL